MIDLRTLNPTLLCRFYLLDLGLSNTKMNARFEEDDNMGANGWRCCLSLVAEKESTENASFYSGRSQQLYKYSASEALLKSKVSDVILFLSLGLI